MYTQELMIFADEICNMFMLIINIIIMMIIIYSLYSNHFQ